MANAEFSNKTRKQIRERADQRCERCGLRGGVMQIHHRNGRRMGGTTRSLLGTPANGLLLHVDCHAWVEAHPGDALLAGLRLHDREDPTRVPVRLWHGWVTLDGYGGFTPVPPPVQ